MNILYIVPSLIQAGPVNVVLELVQVMQEHGHTCDVAYITNRTDRDQNVFPCRTFELKKSVKLHWNNYDVIHSHGFAPDRYVMFHKPRSCRAKTVTTMHNFVFREYTMRYGLFGGILRGAAILLAAQSHDEVITLTNVAKRYYSRYFPPRKLHVCANTRQLDQSWPDEADIKAVNDFRSRNNLDLILGSNCSITIRKGLDQAIKALPQLPSTGLVLTGDGPAMNSLRQLAQECGVGERVLMLGRRSRAWRNLQLYDIFIIPSRNEGFPLSLLEAASMGKASIGSDIDIFRDIFTYDELPKFLLDDIDSLVAVIRQVADDLSGYGNRLREHFQREYSAEEFYRRHIVIYNVESKLG